MKSLYQIKEKIIKSKPLSFLSVIFIGFFIAGLLVLFSPAPPKQDLQKVAALVTVVKVKPESQKVSVYGYGTVQAERELVVKPQVSGHIIEINPDFQIGGRIKKGELILKIDPRDYEIAVETQQAVVARADFEYKLEQGNKVVAEREWELISEDIKVSDLGKELALRDPQIKEKKSSFRRC